MHYMSADQMAGMAPGGAIMVYFTGTCLLAGSIAIMIGKYDKLASVLVAVLLLLFLIPHIHGMMSAADEGTKAMQMINILKTFPWPEVPWFVLHLPKTADIFHDDINTFLIYTKPANYRLFYRMQWWQLSKQTWLHFFLKNL